MSDPKKESSSTITICSQMFYPELISTGLTLTELAEFLVEKNINVNVLCGPPTLTSPPISTKKIMIHNGIKIYRTKGTQFNKLNTIGKLINHLTFAISLFFHLLLSDKKSPILAVTNPPFLGFLISLIKIIKKRPFIYLIFDVYPETAVNANLITKTSFIYKLWQWMNSFTLKKADIVIPIGRCMKNHLQNKHPQLLKNKTTMIPIWCNNKLIQKHPPKDLNPFINKWNLQEKFVILYSGNMGRFHDMKTIMDAAIELRGNDSIKFLFVGEGHQKENCKNTAHNYHLTNCIFSSYVKRNEFSALLATASIGLVSLKKGQEGLSVPSKTFALLAKGIPPIAIMDKHSEISLILDEYKCGITIPNNAHLKLVETILYIQNNRSVLTKMSINAKKAIEKKYNLDNISEAYATLIHKINK